MREIYITLVHNAFIKQKGLMVFQKFRDLSNSNASSNGLSGSRSVNVKVRQFDQLEMEPSKLKQMSRRQHMSRAFFMALDEIK